MYTCMCMSACVCACVRGSCVCVLMLFLQHIPLLLIQLFTYLWLLLWVDLFVIGSSVQYLRITTLQTVKRYKNILRVICILSLLLLLLLLLLYALTLCYAVSLFRIQVYVIHNRLDAAVAYRINLTISPASRQCLAGCVCSRQARARPGISYSGVCKTTTRQGQDVLAIYLCFDGQVNLAIDYFMENKTNIGRRRLINKDRGEGS